MSSIIPPTPILDVIIKNYRGIDSLHISKIGKLNVLTGKNNAGKTSILEAIYLSYNSGSKALRKIMTIRGWSFGASNEYLFNDKAKENINFQFNTDYDYYELNLTNPAGFPNSFFDYLSEDFVNGEYYKYTYRSENKKTDYLFAINKKGVSSSTQSVGPVPNFVDGCTYLNSKHNDDLRDAYAEVIKKDKVNELIKILQQTFNISDIRLMKYKDDYLIFLRINDKYVPAFSVGDGLKWAFILCCSILSLERGILLIDDIENYHHPQSLRNIISVLMNSVKESEIQVFITTHSLECIDFILNEDNAKYIDLKLHYLKNRENKVTSITYDYKEVMESRKIIGTDLRGI